MSAIGGILLGLAKGIAAEVFDEQKDNIFAAVKNTVRDKTESIITGKKTINEWAEIAIKVIDKSIRQITSENNLKYIGGKLNFQISDAKPEYIILAFQLYFLDENQKWQKTEASSDILASNFTEEALEDLKNSGKIEFEVKG